MAILITEAKEVPVEDKQEISQFMFTNMYYLI